MKLIENLINELKAQFWLTRVLFGADIILLVAMVARIILTFRDLGV